MIASPMLAGDVKDNDLSTLEYPLIASPKLDGIRCLRPQGLGPVTRNFKPILNRYLREILHEVLPVGFDGEIIVPGKSFNEIESAVMSFNGQPEFEFHAFDYVQSNLEEPFTFRLNALQRRVASVNSPYIKCVTQWEVATLEELEVLEKECLTNGYEGIIVRKPSGRYKCGRSTAKEGLLLRFKRFKDAEAIITGYTELFHNKNPATKDAFGHTKRSTHRANKIGRNILGSITVQYKDATFKVGSGFSMEERHAYWEIKDSLLGRTITFKYQPSGTKDRPRFPTFKGFRNDIS